jgi:hypothetical protein
LLLAVDGTTTLSLLNWAITDPSNTVVASSTDGKAGHSPWVAGDSTAAEFVIGNIPVGGPYTISLSGADSANDPCSGVSATFVINRAAVTNVSVTLVCNRGNDAAAPANVNTGNLSVEVGVVLAVADAGVCPGISSFSISPAEVAATQTAAVSIATVGPAPAAVLWSAPHGTFDHATALATNFRCGGYVGDVPITVTLTPADGRCSGLPYQTLSGTVHCEAALVAPDAGVTADSSTASDGSGSNADAATVPGAPTGVTATAGTSPNTVSVSIGATDSGGSPITGYSVTSSPAGITAAGPGSPITVTCPSTCTGYAFAVRASNVVGPGALSALTDVITTYNVVETIYEPMTQPKNSIFVGAFTFDSTTAAVSNLRGILSESMTGAQIAYPNDTMTWLSLNNQLSSVYDSTLGGLLVTTFLLTTTNTLWTGAGGDGWAPGTGSGMYYGFPGTNPGNAYARIFVNTANPTAALTQAQIDKLAYADCAPGGMMMTTCMTGTSVAGYGTVGTMHGYPVSQTIAQQ